MEYVEAVLKNIGECVNYKKILDDNMLTLTRKMEELRSREEDINTELRNAKDQGEQEQKSEVETWLKNVQDKRSEVQDIEERVGKIRYFSRSRFLRLVEMKIQEVAELIKEGGFPQGLLIDVLMTTPLVDQSIKERNLRKIWKCLMNDEIISIGVYGMRGIGKTTIVTHLRNRLLESSSSSTFDHVYWVTVSQESNIHKLQDSIAKEIQLDLSDKQDEKKRGAKLIEELEKRKKFVLILDDMWKAFPADEVGIPIGVNAGKLIVTTRSLEVCRGMNCKQNIKVKPLSIKEAWDLFVEILERETVLAPDVEPIAKSIAKKCAGLPLAIITTARGMRDVDNIHEWRNALIEMRELQQYLLYCTLFPEDYKIPREYLIMCWIAEGLVDEMKTRQEDFDRGHDLLKKLENAYTLEHTRESDGKICVKMHHVFRDMALNITRMNPQFMVKAGVQLKELPNEREWSENLERVSLMHNDMEGQLSFISPKCPRLCTLMLQSNHNIQVIPNSLFVYMQNLRVLDLSESKIERLPDSISDLKKVRALLLNNCKELSYVPSLAKLTELRELDLGWTQIKELPHGMEKLVNLKRLDVYPIIKDPASVFPSGVLPNLSHLQSLRGKFDITDDVHVEEIISLRQLEVLAVNFYNLHVFNSYVKTQHWQRLSHYSLQAVVRRGYDFRLSNKVHCRIVCMRGRNLIGGGEDRLVLPTNIQELRLNWCNDLTSLSDISSSLNNVRELERCRIRYCAGIEHLWSWSIPSLEEESLLHSLRTLVLYKLHKLSVLFNFKGVGVGGAPPKCGTFSNLKLFSVGICPNLKYVFTCGLVQHHLQNLEVIHVYDCSEMENIIQVEEEEKQEEIAAAAKEEEDNNSIIKCPKLQSLELEDLPKLKSIWRGSMVCHSLQQIGVRGCRMLKRLPLSLHLNADAQTSSATPLTLKKISGEQRWWDSLEWDHPDAKSVFQPLFDTKEISSVSGNLRARELWRKDAERYEK